MIYKTVQGDTFDFIAKKQMGDEKLAGQLMQANSHLVKTIIFKANIDVIIPEFERVNINYDKVPPWRKIL